MAAIREVVGFIGGDGENVSVRGYVMTVRLWFEKEKNARHADIDKIVIRDAGVKNLEFAINAVILELTKDVSNPIGWTNRIPLILECSSPVSQSCETMLKNNFKWPE